MRHIFQLLTLLALLAAPLAAPAAAMATASATKDCIEQAMEASHEMPAADHGIGEACCIAVPPAIDPPLAGFAPMTAPTHLAFTALAEPFRLGTGPSTDDPPPRFA